MAVCLESNIKEFCAKYIGVAVLLAGLISPGFTAHHQHNTANKNLWQNPCSYQPLIRHGRSAAKIETNMMITNIDHTFFKKLRELYPKAVEVEEPLKIRRTNNCPRINRMLKPIKNASDEFQANAMFYKSLYQIAIFTDSLRDLHIKMNMPFDATKRKEIYEGTKEYLKLALCEIYVIVEPFVSKHNHPPKVNTKCLPKTANLGILKNVDIQFFKKLKKFFKQGRKFLRKFNRNKKHQNRLRTDSS